MKIEEAVVDRRLVETRRLGGRGRADSRPQRRVVRSRQHGGKLIRCAHAANDEPVASLVDDFVRACQLAGDDDPSGRHPLDHRDTPRVLLARENDDVGARVQLGELRRRDTPEEHDAIVDAGRTRT